MARLVAMMFLLAAAINAAAVLCGQQASAPPGLPPPTGPLNIAPDPLTSELGRRLFFDPILSADRTISCATCHDPNRGWSDGRRVAIGIRGQLGTRNTPTLINVGETKPLIFWDGRNVETTDQSVLPIQNPIEMGQQTIEQVVARLNADPNYVRAFLDAFGGFERGRAVTVPRLARCLASFQANLNSYQAPIDAYLAGDQDALTPAEKMGYELCKKANCFVCHPPPLFTDNQTHNVGTEYATRGRIVDEGRSKVTRNTVAFRQSDIGAFKTPTLRSVNRTAPYMHNGRMENLLTVVRHFNAGGHYKIAGRRGDFVDPNISRLVRKQDWTAEQEKIVADFLATALDGRDYPLIGAP